MTELPIRPVWSLSVLYSIHSQFNLPHTPPTLHSYRSSSLSESLFHPFVAFRIVFSCLQWEKWERWQGEVVDGRSTGDKMCQKLVGQIFTPYILSFIHIETFAIWKFLNYVWRIHSLSFPHSSVGKKSTSRAGDPGSIPGLGRSAGEGIGYPLQYSGASWWLSW